MGLFSKSNKTSPIPRLVRPDTRTTGELGRHKTGFYNHAPKNRAGIPIASCMYLNTSPPTLCPELQRNSMFDGDLHEVECYDRGSKMLTHVFNRVHDGARGEQDSVRSVGLSADFAFIKSCLQRCIKDHKHCHSRESTDKLSIITLIDVRNRRLVRYKPDLQYLALSYVWGGVASPKRNPKHPAELPDGISKTIQHAMAVAENIGVPFLWADAVCINQDDPDEKEQQLPLMDYIYEHAFATIFALGDHANVGLSGVAGGPLRKPQVVAEFGSVKLLSRCPTLSSQIKESKWSTRGWTYQEGLFSQRCIFFTPHQVYFHCNTMLCTEDSPAVIEFGKDTNTMNSSANHRYHVSDIHYILSNRFSENKLQTKIQDIGTRNVFDSYLAEYICREVSHDEDAIKAFSAFLSYFQRRYLPNGFVHGVPKDNFIYGLLWRPLGSISRRASGDFPSWSWAAWKFERGGAANATPQLDGGNIPIPSPLRISLGKDRLDRLPAINARLFGLGLELQRLWDAYRTRMSKPVSMRPNVSPSPANALCIDGPVLTLPVTYDPRSQAIGFTAPAHLPKLRTHPSWPCPAGRDAPHKRDFLVLHSVHVTSKHDPCVIFSLMMLEWKSNGVATRAGLLTLCVVSGLDVFWEFAGARRCEFWLV